MPMALAWSAARAGSTALRAAISPAVWATLGDGTLPTAGAPAAAGALDAGEAALLAGAALVVAGAGATGALLVAEALPLPSSSQAVRGVRRRSGRP
ncbi:hypothetical protein [Streptomyces sp. NPDC002722]|uniref:hypothetical protein n=1 Tax=Streptomyces sp. NPDC002722 TaxID=3154425 RepID=UPI0033306CDA